MLHCCNTYMYAFGKRFLFNTICTFLYQFMYSQKTELTRPWRFITLSFVILKMIEKHFVNYYFFVHKGNY